MNSDPTTAMRRPPASIGPYTIVEEAGHGGFGTVYRAEQTHPVRRQVALKVLKTGMASDSGLRRFQAEQQMLAALHHPNIASIFQSGSTAEGLPYFAMEWVDGISLTDYCDRRELPARKRLELFLDLCRAVQHAHQKGIIHRDLKPRNVLVSEDEQSRPRVLVIDFGIAKSLESALDGDETVTLAGGLGTPEYMSPEQSRGDIDIDTRSDVYSLGVILYELLTGTTPLRGTGDAVSGSALETLHRIELAQPPKPSTRLKTLGDQITGIAQRRATEPGPLRRAVRGELDWIVMKALEKDRGRRYDSASALAADVLSFLRGDPVSAGAPTAFYITRKLIARHRAWFAAAGASLLLMSVGAVFCFAMGKRSSAAAIEAETARRMVDHESGLRLKALAHAESIVSRLVTETGAALEMRGRTGVFQDVAERAHSYFAGHPAPEETTGSRATAQAAIARSRLLAAWHDDRSDDALRLPELDRWPVLRASILADAGHREEALLAYQDLPETHAAEVMRDLRVALLAVDDPAASQDGIEKIQAQIDEAIPALQAKLISDPNTAAFRELLADSFAARGALGARDAAVFYEWQRAARDFENAGAHCSRLVALDPDNTRLRRRGFRWALDAAGAWLEAEQLEQAAEIISLPGLDADLAPDADRARCRELRARIAMAQRRHDDAFDAISKALENPATEGEGKARLLGLLGEIESQRGNQHKAADACLQARDLWRGQPARLPADAAAILSAVGRTEEAIAWLRDAIKIHNATADKDSDILIATAASHAALASLLDAGGNGAEAVAHWQSALGGLERQTGLKGITLIENEASAEVAELAFRIRKELKARGQTAATQSRRQTETEKPADDPDPPSANGDYRKAVALSNAGQKSILARRYAEAETRLSDARGLLERLVASRDADPAPTLWRNELAFALTRSVRLCRMVKPPRVEEALVFNDRAIGLRTAIYEETDDPDVLSELKRDYIEKALSHVAGGGLSMGEGVLASCLQDLNEILNSQEPPGNAIVIDSVSECHFRIASIRNKRDDHGGALQALAQSSAAWRELHRRAPNKAKWASDLARTLSATCGLVDRLGQFGRADAAYAEAIDLRGQLARWGKGEYDRITKQLRQSPDTVLARQEIAAARKKIADVRDNLETAAYDHAQLLWRQARHNEHLASLSEAGVGYEKSLQWARLLADIAPSQRAGRRMARGLAGVAGIQLAGNEYAVARSSLEEAENRNPLATTSDRRLRIEIACKLGECLYQLGETEAARARLTEAIELARAAPEPSAESRYLLMRARLSLADLLLESNESEAAEVLTAAAFQPWPEVGKSDALWDIAANALRAPTEKFGNAKSLIINH